MAQPNFNGWYETVKINYGIKPDGSKVFPELLTGFDKKDYEEHFAFWKDTKCAKFFDEILAILPCIGLIKVWMVFDII